MGIQLCLDPDSSPNPVNGISTIGSRAVAFPLTRSQLVSLVLTAIVAVAMTFRVSSLAAYGLSDDEVAKVRATEAYSHGDFTVNAEHPMLMKLVIWASLSATNRWNGAVQAKYEVPIEAAVRLPNAVIGAATVLVVYGVTHAYFGTPAALVAALLVALDPGIIAINRHAKEDTFVVFFFLLAVWLYERGKQAGVRDTVAAQPWYLVSAAAFGLMLASKYLPHLYGLYALFNVATLRDAGPNSPIKRRFFATMGVTFAIANFALFLPGTWLHILRYLRGDSLPHHGGPYAHHLWVTDVLVSSLGMPITFYVMFLLTRVPLVTLVGAGIGAIAGWRHRRERGYVFLRVMLLFNLLGYSLMAAKFLRYILPILVVFNMLAAVGLVAFVTWLVARVKSAARPGFGGHAPAALIPMVSGALAVVLFAGQVQASPFFPMHRTALARWLDADGRRFPEGGYDYGVREAVSQIAARAAARADIVSDVPEVIRFYLERSPRRDLQVKSFAGDGLSREANEQWVLVQEAHEYFETEELIALLEMRHQPVAEYRVNDVIVLQVFRIEKGRL